jgi:hypothetical protein
MSAVLPFPSSPFSCFVRLLSFFLLPCRCLCLVLPFVLFAADLRCSALLCCPVLCRQSSAHTTHNTNTTCFALFPPLPVMPCAPHNPPPPVWWPCALPRRLRSRALACTGPPPLVPRPASPRMPKSSRRRKERRVSHPRTCARQRAHLRGQQRCVLAALPHFALPLMFSSHPLSLYRVWLLWCPLFSPRVFRRCSSECVDCVRQGI